MTHTHKIVDGVKVPLTPQEIARLEARDAEHAALEPERQEERDRYQGLQSDESTLAMMDRLANMTSQQIDNYFANNVTNASAAIKVLKDICKILAVKLTPRGL